MSLTVTGGPRKTETATLPSGVLRVENEVKTWDIVTSEEREERETKIQASRHHWPVVGRWEGYVGQTPGPREPLKIPEKPGVEVHTYTVSMWEVEAAGW